MIVFAQNMNPKLSPMVILKPKRQLSCSRPVNYTSAISDVHNRVYDTNRITHTLTITDFHPLISIHDFGLSHGPFLMNVSGDENEPSDYTGYKNMVSTTDSHKGYSEMMV